LNWPLQRLNRLASGPGTIGDHCPATGAAADHQRQQGGDDTSGRASASASERGQLDAAAFPAPPSGPPLGLRCHATVSAAASAHRLEGSAVFTIVSLVLVAEREYSHPGRRRPGWFSRIASGKSWVVSSSPPTSARVNDGRPASASHRSGSSARTIAASPCSGTNPSELGAAPLDPAGRAQPVEPDAVTPGQKRRTRPAT